MDSSPEQLSPTRSHLHFDIAVLLSGWDAYTKTSPLGQTVESTIPKQRSPSSTPSCSSEC